MLFPIKTTTHCECIFSTGSSKQSPPLWGGGRRFPPASCQLLALQPLKKCHTRCKTGTQFTLSFTESPVPPLQPQDLCQLGVPADYFNKVPEATALLAEKHPLSSCWGYSWQGVQLWFPLLKLICVFHEEAQTQHTWMGIHGLLLLSESHWAAESGSNLLLQYWILHQPLPCLRRRHRWFVFHLPYSDQRDFLQSEEKNGKKWVCGFIPALMLGVGEHCPCGHYLPNFFGLVFPTDMNIWADCRQQRGIVVKYKKKEQCDQLIRVKAETIMRVVTFRRLLWKEMQVLCSL